MKACRPGVMAWHYKAEFRPQAGRSGVQGHPEHGGPCL